VGGGGVGGGDGGGGDGGGVGGGGEGGGGPTTSGTTTLVCTSTGAADSTLTAAPAAASWLEIDAGGIATRSAAACEIAVTLTTVLAPVVAAAVVVVVAASGMVMIASTATLPAEMRSSRKHSGSKQPSVVLKLCERLSRELSSKSSTLPDKVSPTVTVVATTSTTVAPLARGTKGG